MRNSFRGGKFHGEIIVDENGAVVGEIRITPAAVKWRPKNKGKYYSVSLKKFVEWITDDETKAGRTKS